MRLEESLTVRARPSAVWGWIGDPSRYEELMGGASRWLPVDERPGVSCVGVGSRYSALLHVGSAEVGGVVEVTECRPSVELAWTSITGLEQRGRWRIRELQPGVTCVVLRLSWHSPGGVSGLVADRVAAPRVRAIMRTALRTLRERCEGASPEQDAQGGATPLGFAMQQLRSAVVLARTGLLRPERPDRLLGAALAVHRWGLSVAGGWSAAAVRFGGQTAIVDDLGSLTFAEVEERSNRLANSLRDHGLREGDRAGVMCRNHRGFVEATLALSKLGVDVLYLNTGFAAPQLREVLRREDVAAVVVDEEFEHLVGDAVATERCFLAWTDRARRGDRILERLIAHGDPAEPEAPETPSRITILTSGTTGTPKGASRSQPRSADPAVAILSRIPLRARGTTCIAAPLFHAWGLAHLMLGTLLSSTLVLQRRFDPEALLAAVEEHGVDTVAAVPVMLQRILDLPEDVRGGYDVSSLRVVAVSGSALAGDLSTRFMDAFGDVVYNLYGSTEVAWVSIATPEDLRAAPGTAGRPPLGTVVRLLDGRERDVAAGGTGRIFVRNEMLFEGYTGGGTKDTVDGFMSTGDLGRFDEGGRLFVDGREDDMIVSGGENVFPAEVEEVLGQHDGIAEAVVVGVPDEEWGQRLRAYVVTARGAQLGADDVKRFVRERLARYKVPRDVEFVAELPRNATGKVVRRELGDDAGAKDDSAPATRRRAPASGRAGAGNGRGGSAKNGNGATGTRRKTAATTQRRGRGRGDATAADATATRRGGGRRRRTQP